MPETEIERLLETLCVKFGFCLAPKISNRLVKFPPRTSAKFAESVIVAEGLNPESMDKNLYKNVLKEIENVFEIYQ